MHSFVGKTVTRGGYGGGRSRALSIADGHNNGNYTPEGTVGAFGGTETRPKNIALLYCTPE